MIDSFCLKNVPLKIFGSWFWFRMCYKRVKKRQKVNKKSRMGSMVVKWSFRFWTKCDIKQNLAYFRPLVGPCGRNFAIRHPVLNFQKVVLCIQNVCFVVVCCVFGLVWYLCVLVFHFVLFVFLYVEIVEMSLSRCQLSVVI